MYRAIIADDEQAVRRGLINHFDWTKYDVEVVADFPDGQKALNYINSNPVDLVVTDVRMPNMDGIELTKHIREQYPKTKIIFISGYEDTVYLRNALKMDVVDYVLKSIDLKEFEKDIVHVLEIIERENLKDQTLAELEEKLTMSIPLLQQRSLMLLIRDDSSSENEDNTYEHLSFLNIPLSNDVHYCVLVLQLLNIWRSFSRMNERQRLMFSLQFQSDVVEILKKYGSDICFENSIGEFAIIVNAEAEGFEDILLSVSEELQQLVEVKYFVQCRIGISERFKGLTNVHSSYESAVNAIHSRYFIGDSHSISVDKFKEIVAARSVKEHAEKEISSALLSGDYLRVQKIMEEIFAELDSMPADVEQQNFLVFLLLLPTRVLSGIRSGEKGAYDNHRSLLSRFLCCGDMSEQKLLILHLYQEVAVLINSRSESHSHHIIERVKQAIETRYMEQLSISSLAEEVYLTPTYLCVLFKQATGQTLNEFITLVRMQRAKALLADTSIKLYDVCYKIGYLSPSYFSKLFKKYSGFTPSEFRESSLEIK